MPTAYVMPRQQPKFERHPVHKPSTNETNTTSSRQNHRYVKLLLRLCHVFTAPPSEVVAQWTDTCPPEMGAGLSALLLRNHTLASSPGGSSKHQPSVSDRTSQSLNCPLTYHLPDHLSTLLLSHYINTLDIVVNVRTCSFQKNFTHNPPVQYQLSDPIFHNRYSENNNETAVRVEICLSDTDLSQQQPSKSFLRNHGQGRRTQLDVQVRL